MILKNKATYIYKITLLVVLILLVLFLSRNFHFSSVNDSEQSVHYDRANLLSVQPKILESRANNSYVQAISQELTNSALPLINLFVSSANASEYGLILIKTGSLNFAVKNFDTAYESIKTKIQNQDYVLYYADQKITLGLSDQKFEFNITMALWDQCGKFNLDQDIGHRIPQSK